MRKVLRTTGLGALACALLLGAVAGCGSDEGGSADEIQQARKEAASAARQDERIKQLERELRQRERNSGRNSGGSEPDSGGSEPDQTAPAPAAPSANASCGNSVSVGPNTSCPFAHEVRAAYEQSGGASTIQAYSSVTGVTYTMSCTAGSPHACTGGNDASVYFP